MTRWLLLIPLAMAAAGCRAPGNMYAPYGPTCVPPPGTGALGAPYYQAPTYGAPYGAPYGAYPSATVPSDRIPMIPGAPGMGVSGSPLYAGSAPVAISPYMANEGAWASGAQVVTLPPPPGGSSTRQPLQPRPSGELVASGAQFSRNENLRWGSQIQQASVAVPHSGSRPTVASASYDGPVRPSAAPSGVIYDTPVEYAAPTYYPNEYVLDPYAATYGPYAAQPAGAVARTAPEWAPRR
jgi:hypothetical protein